jgi:hypothetical protein
MNNNPNTIFTRFVFFLNIVCCISLLITPISIKFGDILIISIYYIFYKKNKFLNYIKYNI